MLGVSLEEYTRSYSQSGERNKVVEEIGGRKPYFSLFTFLLLNFYHIQKIKMKKVDTQRKSVGGYCSSQGSN